MECFRQSRWFPYSDAFTLAGIIQKEKPERIVEVGSGFSSAVMLDAIGHSKLSTQLTCIEPFPDRLNALLDDTDRDHVRVISERVQDVAISVFEQLQAGDILFIDSSHVAKVGSDVTHLMLRVLPRLAPGVIVHFHDIVYPNSYPGIWNREGRAWNESIFLRAFLAHNRDFQVFAFNSFAGYSFPELFNNKFPEFLAWTGGSIWIRRLDSQLD